MSLVTLKSAFKPQLDAMDRYIDEAIKQASQLTKNVMGQMQLPQGKRLRPLAVMVAASACEDDQMSMDRQDTIKLACIIELFHVATLLHDDVIDQSQTRRGVTTAAQAMGNKASILVGDYCYALAFEWIAQLNDPKVTRILAKSTRLITAGEITQLARQGHADFTRAAYVDVIDAKTAELFSTACCLGALSVHGDPDIVRWFAQWGRSFGLWYQMLDDGLDYFACSKNIGKPTYQDIDQGKVTLPLIMLYEKLHASQQNQLSQWVMYHEQLDRKQLEQWMKQAQIQAEWMALMEHKANALIEWFNAQSYGLNHRYAQMLIEGCFSRLDSLIEISC